ncbi:hypothetical protein Q1695_003846 [Nippostrongylus brasiliensis]|nr:hypothetical protein Q1695_003846 [Nippostrongylus brasiliensis]
MMPAARSGMLRYKKRKPTSKTPQKKNRSSSMLSVGSEQRRGSTTPSDQLLTPNSNSLLTVPMMRKRSGSIVMKGDAVIQAMFWNLKKEQVRALRMTWSRLCEPPRSNCRGIVNLVERVWEKLDNKDPSLRNIFYNAAFVETMHDRCERRRSKESIATLRDHTHFFVSLVSQVVQNLDNDPDSILEHIDHIGRSHAYLKQYGFRSSHWEKVGEYFVDIVVIQDCVRGYPEGCRAWTILVAALVDRIRAAPRRGSMTPSRPSSRASLDDSSQKLLSPSRCGSTHQVSSDNQSHNDTEFTANALKSPRRKSGFTGSITEIGSGCVNMASLQAALPDVRPGNPAVA